jgi:chemotaxis protein methyltransferase CheR
MPELRPTLPPELFPFFAEHIYTLSGMRFDISKSYFLAAKISLRLQALGLPDFHTYRNYLTGPQGAAENPFLLDKVTINETFFYRHEPQLRAFQTDILSPLLHTGKPLRIWSAASSSGDELYTLALMLQQMRPLPPIELIGTDISRDALAKAHAAAYRRYNIRNVPADQLQTYFTHHATQPEVWSLADDIKRQCTFHHGNIMDSAHTQSLGLFDIIFCRNMLIYFDAASKRTATANLAAALAPGGLVLLGTSDDIYSQRTILKPHPIFTTAIAYTPA